MITYLLPVVAFASAHAQEAHFTHQLVEGVRELRPEMVIPGVSAGSAAAFASFVDPTISSPAVVDVSPALSMVSTDDDAVVEWAEAKKGLGQVVGTYHVSVDVEVLGVLLAGGPPGAGIQFVVPGIGVFEVLSEGGKEVDNRNGIYYRWKGFVKHLDGSGPARANYVGDRLSLSIRVAGLYLVMDGSLGTDLRMAVITDEAMPFCGVSP